VPQTIRVMGRPKKGITPLERLEDQIFYSPDGCWYFLGPDYSTGYSSFYLNKLIGAHRAAYILYKSPIPKGLHVLHTCDNRKCVNPDHLFLGSNADNIADKVSKNRQYRPFGTKSPKAKLNQESVAEIRRLKGIDRYLDIAKRFNVSPSHIHKIWRNEFWIQNND
jgi:hypothetical protein